MIGVLRLEVLRLEVKLPGPRLLEPVGTICHLPWQTRPKVSFAEERRGKAAT